MAGAEAIQRPERKKMHVYKSEDGYKKLVPPPIRSQHSQRCRQPVKTLWRILGSGVSPIRGRGSYRERLREARPWKGSGPQKTLLSSSTSSSAQLASNMTPTWCLRAFAFPFSLHLETPSTRPTHGYCSVFKYEKTKKEMFPYSLLL